MEDNGVSDAYIHDGDWVGFTTIVDGNLGVMELAWIQ